MIWIGRASVLVMTIAVLAACTTAPAPRDHPRPSAGSAPWGTVTGTVRTTAGRPAPGVLVVPTAAGASTPPAPEKAVRTDDAGHYRWQLMPGRYVLAARHADRVSAGVTVTVTAGQRAYADLTID
ncbi:carboxypeptidase-like regulatory domain-containing protein [Couchioplanes caeruleus]|uniref:carboxypeptidase-like regulatory domain-containing protein n=1 Tax=Couchioplanes caeruleus TaxID=56438 RepID=UPI0020BE577B|nr:carboxypeptidase-like regulatory domain-containing protein [Couchioplanes caeruleus]UQU67983.1 carboxypeptidase-like regulatory domain-containing protein [Couchioplanes caeruleus]